LQLYGLVADLDEGLAVVVEPGKDITSGMLKIFARKNAAPFKVPKKVRFI
jgi:hypothetical protein